MHRRFQGISLEQQRKANKKKKKKGRNAERRESSVSGSFNPCLSRSTSSVSAAARANPFGLQVKSSHIIFRSNVYTLQS